jgi:hypothetical protein
MRAMTEWRRRLRKSGKFESGKLMLFFGARTREELPYFGPLTSLPKDFIDINLAFSRTPGQPKKYVQDLIHERAVDLVPLLADPNSHFYVCGLKAMEEGVVLALRDVAVGAELDWDRLALKRGRLHLTYWNLNLGERDRAERASSLDPLIGVLDHRIGSRGPAGQAHDQADDEAVEDAVARIVQPSGENVDPARMPPGAAQEGADVGVRSGTILAGLAGDDVDREIRARHRLERRRVPPGEVDDARVGSAVADPRADHREVEAGRRDVLRVTDHRQRDRHAGVFQHSAQAFANPPRLSVGG